MLNFQKKKSLTSSAECTKNIIKFMIFQGAAAPVYGAAALVFFMVFALSRHLHMNVKYDKISKL